MADQIDAKSRLIFALDYADLQAARAGGERVAGQVGLLKIGLELFLRHGPEAVGLGRELGLEVFLDLKLHDIPATVGRAVASAGQLGARLLTVHASGGEAMLRTAVEQAAQAPTPLQVVAVTVLTSLDDGDLQQLGIHHTTAEQALGLARIAWRAGVRAFVCSPAEASGMRDALGPEAKIITPGVRPAGGQSGDQKRVRTPSQAIAAGADMLVVGRPIRDAGDPAAAAKSIVEEIASALSQQS